MFCWPLSVMMRILANNKQGMVALLCVAAIVALILATKGRGLSDLSDLPDVEDASDHEDVFTTTRLPSDKRLMTSVGNGHLATNVFSDTVYMNGLYNGAKGESHRARIPSWANIRLTSTLHRVQDTRPGHMPSSKFLPTFSLNTSSGVFEVVVPRDKSIVRHRIYAHKFYTRAIINQVVITARNHGDYLFNDFNNQIKQIDLSFNPGQASKDIDLSEPEELYIEDRRIWKACGQTKASEDFRYQEKLSKVCVYWTDVPDHLVVPKYGTKIHTFVMTVDSSDNIAYKEMVMVLQEKQDNLYGKHKLQWSKMYEDARMKIEGNIKLAKIINGMWYYLLSSLPSEHTNQKNLPFFGLSPGGLSRGALLQDYQGHSFWDTELWMFPSIVPLYPQLGLELLRYRMRTAGVAADRARDAGFKGIKFAWESAFTGEETTQPCCPEISEFEIHITACVAHAARQYVALTRDEHWLKNGGCAMVANIAEFWESRSTLNPKSGFYDIPRVMGPDEDHKDVKNNAFTNVIAGYSLYFAQYVSCLCKSFFETRDADHWADIAWKLALPYDPKDNYHPQYEGYKKGVVIKQADAVLLGFPLQYKMNQSTRINDLNYYEGVTRASGPAMTWSMHAIGHLRSNQPQHAAIVFNRSYQNYVRGPFKVWTEQQKPDVGAVNFLTGMGGFLQTFIFGYGGISIYLDRLEIRKPQLPEDSTGLEIKGLKYLGTSMQFNIGKRNSTIKILNVNEEWPLEITLKTQSIKLKLGTTVYLDGGGPFVIRTTKDSVCSVPLDLIGQKGPRPKASNKKVRKKLPDK